MRVEDAIYKTVHRDLEVFATRMGMSPNTMNHKANPNREDAYFRPRELITLMQLSGDYSILHAASAELGGQFVEPKNYANVSDAALLNMFTALMARNGEFADDFQRAWDDGSLSEKEFTGLCDDIYQVKQVCAELQLRMAAMVERRPPVANVERLVPAKAAR